ncbi:hypothetical protein HYV43_02290 [Candidatus Micrarchaeota archaeon]|nr:hypothetical protein [Candidatus Micrarchaeota archaeon]
MTNGQNTMIYAALAVILVVVLASSFYSFSQLGTLNAKIADLQSNGNNAALLSSLTSRIQSLEQKIQELQVTAKVVLFYDSSCTFCNNNYMLNSVDQTRQILAQQGIGLNVVDIKDNPRAALASGVRNVPVFFAGKSDLSSNSKLVGFFNSLAQLQFALQESDDGVTAYPPATAKVIQNTSCQESGKVNVEEFYSPTCAFCRPVYYANGTRYNDAGRDAQFSTLSGDAANATRLKFGDKLALQQRCLDIHTLDENRDVLNLTQSDGALCIEQNGEAALDESEAAADLYGVTGAPTFVIDCQYITKVRDADQLQRAICDLRPELCKGLPEPTLPPEILAAIRNQTANAANGTT